MNHSLLSLWPCVIWSDPTFTKHTLCCTWANVAYLYVSDATVSTKEGAMIPLTMGIQPDSIWLYSAISSSSSSPVSLSLSTMCRTSAVCVHSAVSCRTPSQQVLMIWLCDYTQDFLCTGNDMFVCHLEKQSISLFPLALVQFLWGLHYKRKTQQ